VSVLANFGHAVEYERNFATSAQSRYCFFGRFDVLTADTKVRANPELARAKQTIKELRSDLEAAEEHLADAEVRANAAEQRFGAAGELLVRLFAEEKRQRILAAAERWPELAASSVAIVAGASASYVTEVLRGRDSR
jgi:hypothetical protein